MKRNCYKSHKTILSSIAMLATIVWTQGVLAVTEEDLEPCINGGVSATGLFASQAAEDQAKKFVIVRTSRLVEDLDLEPCIDGGVSATGLYISQDAEDLARKRRIEAEKQVAQADEDC